MNVCVVGSGGREHALVKKLHGSVSIDMVYAYPGGDAIFNLARPITASSLDELVHEMLAHGVDLCVIGPETFLEKGLADKCRNNGILSWGPDETSACLETSKQFAREFMNRHGIPAPDYRVVHSPAEIREAVEGFPVVLKYDGLAGGKGVMICDSSEDVEEFIREVFEQKRFGEPEPILVEECLEGPEVSVICAVSDGDYLSFPPARDYKRLEDGDRGPNTGGMGVVASNSLLCSEQYELIEHDIIQPTVRGLNEDGLGYRGFLFFGLMLTNNGPRVLEYNCRFGDPEAQAILPLVKGDFASLLYEGASGSLDTDTLSFSRGWSVSVVCASEGYPYDPKLGKEIRGLNKVESAEVFHAGTQQIGGSKYETDGGRVLAVNRCGPTREEAVKKAYESVGKVDFDGVHYRKDIGRLHFEQPATAGAERV